MDHVPALQLETALRALLHLLHSGESPPALPAEMESNPLFQETWAEALKLRASLEEKIVACQECETTEKQQHILSEALRDAAAALNSTLEFDEVLERILVNVERVIPHDTANIALLGEDNSVQFMRFHGYAENKLPQKRLAALNFSLEEMPNLRRMFASGQPLIISDTQADPDWMDIPTTTPIRSYAGLPLRVKNQVVGFLNLNSVTPGFYTLDHVHRLQAFADQVAIAFENARLFSTVQRRADEITAIYQIGQAIASNLELNQVLKTLQELCIQILPIDVFYVAIYHHETGIISHPLLYDRGRYRHYAPRDIRVIPGLSGHVILTRQTLYLPDTLDPETTEKYQVIHTGGKPVRAYVGVPLLARDQVVGVISMQSYQPHAYTPNHIRLLETIASQAAIAILNANLYEQMKHLATIDPLTGLFNRRQFAALAKNEFARARRYQRPLTLLMFDLDLFKHVNDAYGHAFGDQVLQRLAAALQSKLRPMDIFCRYGGDEFIVLLPEADAAEGQEIAEGMRQAAADLEIAVPEASSGIAVETGAPGTANIHITISLGVATLTAAQDSLEALMACADQALYRAKNNGRNQVQVYS